MRREDWHPPAALHWAPRNLRRDPSGDRRPRLRPRSPQDDPPPAQEFTLPQGRTLAEIERMAIVQTLMRTNWNKQEAAQQLGLYRPTLYSKMRKHKIVDERAQRLDASSGRRPRPA